MAVEYNSIDLHYASSTIHVAFDVRRRLIVSNLNETYLSANDARRMTHDGRSVARIYDCSFFPFSPQSVSTTACHDNLRIDDTR